MKLWTVQPFEFYEKLISVGKICCSEEHTTDFKRPYDWMIIQMENRIGFTPPKKCYPIWAWYQYQNSKKKKPDLRNSCLLEKGKKGVRIEFVKERKEVLLSDFDLWHYVLNYWYIADNQNQEFEFKKRLKELKIDFFDKGEYSPELINIVEKSWNKIFDMNYNYIDVAEKKENKQIQATFWELDINEITKVDIFRAR